MVTFTTLRRPLLPKPEYWLGLFCRFLQQEGSRSSTTLDAFTIIASYGSSSTPVVNYQYEILSNFANVAQNSRSSITLEPFAMKREIWIQPFVFHSSFEKNCSKLYKLNYSRAICYEARNLDPAVCFLQRRNAVFEARCSINQQHDRKMEYDRNKQQS